MADKFTFFLCFLLAAIAAAEPMSPPRALETIRAYFEAGRFEETVAKSKELLASSELTNEQRLALNRFAGLAAFNLDDLKSAEDFFVQILFQNPDYVMDPFATPPAAIQYFESLRSKNETALQVVRQQMSERETQDRRLGSDAPVEPPVSAPQSPRPAPQPFDFRVFLPFGVPQFQQARPAQGVTLALTQGLLAIGSIVGFWALESLYQTQTVTVEDRLGGNVSYTVRGIPFRRQNEAAAYRTLKEVSAIGFYVAYAAGVTEGILLQQKPLAETEASVHLKLNFMSGGAGAALTLSF